MATKPVPVSGKGSTKMCQILPETPEMEAFLGAGYDMNVAEAEAIIKERMANPDAYPYDIFKKAQAFLAAYHASPVAIDTEPGWKRRRQPQKEV
jgi:hypothetical protein